MRLCDFAVIFLVYACVDRSADLLVGACWGCLFVGEPDSDAGPSIGPYHQAKILFFPTRSLRNRTCIPSYKLSLGMRCGLTRHTLQVRGMTIPPLPLLAATLCPFGCKGAPLPPLPPSLHCRLLIGSQVVELVGVFLPLSIVLRIGVPKDVDVPHFSKQNCWYCLIPPLYGVVSALSPPCLRGTSFISPLLVLYQCTLEICANLLAK